MELPGEVPSRPVAGKEGRPSPDSEDLPGGPGLPDASTPRSLWRHPDFLRLWTGQTVSALGSAVTRTAIQFVAILLLGAGPGELGILAAAGSVGTLLVGLAAGVWVDRMRRRPILIAADLGRAALLLTIPLAAAAGALRAELLYAVVLLGAALGAFFDVAYRSYLPSLIGRDRLVEGNAKLGLSASLAEIGGPGLAGTIVQLFSAVSAIVVDAVSFLVSAVSFALIRSNEPPPAPRARRSLGPEIAEGLAAVGRDPRLRAMAGYEATRFFFGSFIGVLYSLFALRDLSLPPFAVGLLISVGGVGAFLGAVLLVPVARRRGIGPTIVGAALAGGVLVFLIPLAGGPPLAAATFLFAGQLLGDALFALEEIGMVSVRQGVTPDALLGRVNATRHVLLEGIAPLGALAGAGLAEVMGARATLFVAAAGILLANAWLVLSPLRSLKVVPGPPPGAPGAE